MSDGRRTLNPQELKELLEKLDDVMSEAARLRHEVSRQLAERNRERGESLSPPASGLRASTRHR